MIDYPFTVTAAGHPEDAAPRSLRCVILLKGEDIQGTRILVPCRLVEDPKGPLYMFAIGECMYAKSELRGIRGGWRWVRLEGAVASILDASSLLGQRVRLEYAA